ncbi:hypothetical protein FS749_002893 [Ceratobasidium sp. UAMH 11750]|nr:hypothetical protein FS749_002893 [Ceratobasidium sp. UAMH 11750]
MIDTAHAALQFLWVLLESRGRIPVEDHHKIRLYAKSIFEFFQYLQRKRVLTPAKQHRFAEMLAKAEIIALVGRILLLVLEDGNEFKNVELVDETVAELFELENIIHKSETVARELFLDSKIEWAKVLHRFGAFADMHDFHPAEENGFRLISMSGAWHLFTPAMGRDYTHTHQNSWRTLCVGDAKRLYTVTQLAKPRIGS